jgi:hypothetical protein
MKLKFSEPLPKLILEGKKNITWRVNDEKDISSGRIISLCYNNGKEFAKASILSVKDTVFGKLTEDDKKGHEEFASEKEMYEIYSKYYKMQIDPETKLKVIKFELL